MTAPAHEWPTRTTGPSAFRIARLVAATSFSSESSGFWTAMTLSPAFSRYGMTFPQDDPSANAPWTRTAVLAFSSAAEAGRPIAAIAVRMRLKPITPLYDFIATFLRLVGILVLPSSRAARRNRTLPNETVLQSGGTRVPNPSDRGRPLRCQACTLRAKREVKGSFDWRTTLAR